MKNAVVKLVDTYGTIILISIMMLLFFRSCSQTSAINKLTKEIEIRDSIETANAAPTKQDIDRIVSERLYDFLIFEDDLDKKKTSLSEIRLKISKDDKK
jgi:hypothetical protein